MSAPIDPRAERVKTDESLAVERQNADRAISEKEVAVERTADAVVARAREDADDLLTEARSRADDRLRQAPAAPAAVATERREEDADLRRERAAADAGLRRERAAADEVLRQEREVTRARLFPIERDQTDLYLRTERNRSDVALANRDDFLGMVTHDLRDLLSTVVMTASVVADGAPADDPGAATLAAMRRIQRAAGRMTRLIGDLVDVASIEAGKLAMVPVAADGADLVVEAIETWTPLAAAKALRLTMAPPRGPTSTMIDRERILQVLGNLITNAAKFSPRTAEIRCGVEAIDDHLSFFVEDHGTGIPGDQLEAIFERFWQVGGNDRRGLGLGLYISRCIVEAHDGRIWATSEPGQGSTFYFTVPRAGALAPERAAAR